jgi:hypothetical protein
MTSSFVLTLSPKQYVISDAGKYLRDYQNGVNYRNREIEETGHVYMDYKSTTPSDPNKVVPEDLAVTLLINSRIDWKAFRSLQDHGSEIDLSQLPQKPLEQTSAEERQQVAALIAKMTQFDGFAASVATKVLHKKRPALIPILDNLAIFGAYMNPNWPQKPASSDSVKKDENRIYKALDWIAFDLNRAENVAVWNELQSIAPPERSRIQLFDSVWWMYFQENNSKKEQ